MTFIPESIECDEPGCRRREAMTVPALRALHAAGWRGYFEGEELRHHCPDHPVETVAGIAVDGLEL